MTSYPCIAAFQCSSVDTTICAPHDITMASVERKKILLLGGTKYVSDIAERSCTTNPLRTPRSGKTSIVKTVFDGLNPNRAMWIEMTREIAKTTYEWVRGLSHAAERLKSLPLVAPSYRWKFGIHQARLTSRNFRSSGKSLLRSSL